MYYATEVLYEALRSLPGYENERASITLKCDDATDPLKALAEAKRLVNVFLGESKVSSSHDSVEGDDPIMPEEPPAVSPVIDDFEDDIPF